MNLGRGYSYRHYLTWIYENGEEQVQSGFSLNTMQLSLKCSRLLESVGLECAAHDYEKDRSLKSFPEELRNELAPVAEPRGQLLVRKTAAEMQAEMQVEADADLEYLKLAVRGGKYKPLSAAKTIEFPFPSLKMPPGQSHYSESARAKTCAECMWVLRELHFALWPEGVRPIQEFINPGTDHKYLTWVYDHTTHGRERVWSDNSLNTNRLSRQCSSLLSSVGVLCKPRDYDQARSLKSFPEELWNEHASIAEPRGRPLVIRTAEEVQAEAEADAQGAADGDNDQSLAFHHHPPAHHATAQHLPGWINSVAHSAQDAIRRLGRISVGARRLRAPIKPREGWILQPE
ncbi:MAG: hypothetical protein M1826_000992 [Phylliscum demangeonii]|nr:MAG: hypothetical protein M1826_000992 [Phylliscum demangeonii]